MAVVNSDPGDYAERSVREEQTVYDPYQPVRIEPEPSTVRVSLAGETLATTPYALRVEEDPLTPVWYLPVEALTGGRLVLSETRTCCPHKGQAVWYSMVDGPSDVAWCYRTPHDSVAAIAHRIAFDGTLVTVELDGTPALRSFSSPTTLTPNPPPA